MLLRPRSRVETRLLIGVIDGPKHAILARSSAAEYDENFTQVYCRCVKLNLKEIVEACLVVKNSFRFHPLQSLSEREQEQDTRV